MPSDFFPRLLVCVVAAWTCFDGPGRALLSTGASALPPAFARVLWSAIVTTLVSTALAAGGQFSLAHLLSANLLFCVVAFPLRRVLAGAGANPAIEPRRDLVGPLLFLAALTCYWPGYPAFLGAADSTAYVTTGVSLAHHGTLWRQDTLLGTVPPVARPVLFDSMSQVFASSGPPYRRAPGALLVENHEATRAWPDFFPVPSVWSAVFVAAAATGEASAEQAAPNYAPVFAALALWAFWLLARTWLGTGYALAAVVLLGASAPFYMFARLPMSEPIAAFFALSSLAVLSAGGATIGRGDAVLAGAALGAAVFTRIEMSMFVSIALALQPSLQPRRDGTTRWRPAPAFLGALAVVGALTVVPAATVPGTWTLPLVNHLDNAWIRLILAHGRPTNGELAVGAGIASTLAALAVRHFGWSATLRWSFLCAVLGGHAAESRYLAERTPMWLSFAIGWQGMAMAALGGLLAWRSRSRPAAASFVLAMLAAVTAILFYNPHVYPALPWGWRRFVPLLLPLAILAACHAARLAHSRSRVFGVALLALLAWPVWTGGRPLWGRPQMEGALETLVQLDEAIPRKGIVLVDREISSTMASPALWLARDRENITAPPTGTPAGRQLLPMLAHTYLPKGAIYYVTRGAGVPARTPHLKFTLVSRVPLSLLLLEQTYDRRPSAMQRFLMPLAVYRIDPTLDPLGEPVR